MFDEGVRSSDRFDCPEFSLKSDRSKVPRLSRCRGNPPENCLEVVGTRCTIFDRPTRSDIRRVAVWDLGLQRAFFPSLPEHCGLFNQDVVDLLYRDITPDDYETLLRLDETIPKKTASIKQVTDLESVSFAVVGNDTCGVCLADFEEDDVIKRVPCPNNHLFHDECIAKWLLECKNSCPVDYFELSH